MEKRVKLHILMGGVKFVKKAFNQALMLQAVKMAAKLSVRFREKMAGVPIGKWSPVVESQMTAQLIHRQCGDSGCLRKHSQQNHNKDCMRKG
jgi:hypothetical protein